MLRYEASYVIGIYIYALYRLYYGYILVIILIPSTLYRN